MKEGTNGSTRTVTKLIRRRMRSAVEEYKTKRCIEKHTNRAKKRAEFNQELIRFGRLKIG